MAYGMGKRESVCKGVCAHPVCDAQFLAQDENGIAWRKENNISYVASADELLQWFKEANPNTPHHTTIWYQLEDKAELRVEP
jgi:hypothetical protein